jgi:hypothetical protein
MRRIRTLVIARFEIGLVVFFAAEDLNLCQQCPRHRFVRYTLIQSLTQCYKNLLA